MSHNPPLLLGERPVQNKCYFPWVYMLEDGSLAIGGLRGARIKDPVTTRIRGHSKVRPCRITSTDERAFENFLQTHQIQQKKGKSEMPLPAIDATVATSLVFGSFRVTEIGAQAGP
jgi:hypothetical protein